MRKNNQFLCGLHEVIHTLSASEIFIPLFICTRELSPCYVVHREDWVPVSGRVGDFARGEESFNFVTAEGTPKITVYQCMWKHNKIKTAKIIRKVTLDQ